MGIELKELEELMKTSHSPAPAKVENTIDSGRQKLKEIIDEVQPGNFVEISRVDEKRTLSAVAQKYIENREEFRERMQLFFDDTCEFLEPGQSIEISLSDR